MPKSIISLLLSATLCVLAAASPASANSKYAGLVVDARTGQTLYNEHADASRYPASLTKMMTLYMVFQALDARAMSKSSKIRISKYAAGRPPSKLGLKPGSTITVEQGIYALVTKSANDVATAIAEHIGGTESKFGAMMTAKAHALGMRNTTFVNASGLPDRRQKTTARDMATLGIALREHFPHYYAYFNTRSFQFGNRKYGNHNRLLGRVKGVDGIKTGYINASGFNLVTSIIDNDRKVVAVVMGGRTGKSRDQHMADLIKRYLPKASRKGGNNLIAKAGGPVVVAGAAPVQPVAPKKVPLPNFRAPDRPRAASVYTASATPEPAPKVALGSPVVGKDALRAMLVAMMPADQKPSAKRPVNISDQARAFSPLTSANKKSSPIDSVMTAAVPAKNVASASSGWVIQIAAMPDKRAADQLLAEAKQKATALGSRDPFTMEIEKNGTKLYRARFAGFEDKQTAWDACGQLKKLKYNCLALQN